MEVNLPMMVQDQALADVSKLVEGFIVKTEPYFLDGPVTERVAILDFDDVSGELLPGTPFFALRPTKIKGARGEYRHNEENQIQYFENRKKKYHINTRDFNRVSVLATILKTMALFEDEAVLSRKLSWAFDGPQLLVIPRAGEWANAFYQRDTRSLQFFYFPKAKAGNGEEQEWVYTSLSRDIIVHETTHAILDGIVPDLYDASTPQSLAIHEGLADLTAVVLAFKSNVLARAVLESTAGEIDKPSEFSNIAREFGQERSGADALREIYNPDIKLDKVRQEPHFLSVVLSSALYELMIDLYKIEWPREIKNLERKNKKLVQQGEPPRYPNPRLSASGKALSTATSKFERVAFAALDFLPPGEVSFADYGRAIIASQRNLINNDGISDSRKKRLAKRISFVVETFQKRGIPLTENDPGLITEFEKNFLEGVDLDNLISSDWIAYQFANDNRELLSIPSDSSISFEVQPRCIARDKHLNNRPKVTQSQLFFKVSWTKTEPIKPKRPGLPPDRRIVVGTTLVIDLDLGVPIAVLHTDHDPALSDSRDTMLSLLLDQDMLGIGPGAVGPNDQPLDSVIQAEDTGGALKLSGVANMLHITNA